MRSAGLHELNGADARELPLDELLKRFVAEVSNLAEQEIELAKAELREKAQTARRGGALVAAGLGVALMGVGALTAAVILALAIVMPAWLAASIVAILLGSVAWILTSAGAQAARRAMPPVPERTVDKVKEDVGWVAARARSEMRSPTPASDSRRPLEPSDTRWTSQGG